MMTSDDKVGRWVKKGQNHDDVILEWSLTARLKNFLRGWLLVLGLKECLVECALKVRSY